VRDELLLRGLVLRVASGPARWPSLVACGLASVAAALGRSPRGLSAPALIATAVGGVLFGAVWLRERGAWGAVFAHAAWLWATATLARGALVDVRAASTPWASGEGGIESGWAAVVTLSLLAIVALVAWRRPAA
jgi:membrane protease YdiL (CAAX protease family)